MKEAEKKTGDIKTLHQRLQHALSLGSSRCRGDDRSGRKWECRDIETQRLVLRAIGAFLDCISKESLKTPLVKESIADIVGALVGILEQSNGTTVCVAASLVGKLARAFTEHMLRPHFVDLIEPLPSLSVTNQLHVASASIKALNSLLSIQTKTKEAQVWEMLHKAETLTHLINFMQGIPGSMDSDLLFYVQEATTLVGTILKLWPQSRYLVWSNEKLMASLAAIFMNSDPLLTAALLKFYSSLALCGYGAIKILESGKSFLEKLLHSLGSTHPQSVRIEGFKLAQRVMINENECSRIINLYAEPIVEATVSAMSHEGKIAAEQIPLLVEACRFTAVITRWAGKHHICFWRLGIGKALHNLLSPQRYRNISLFQDTPVENLISQLRERLANSSLFVLRPYIWDILGSLVIHCDDNFHPQNVASEDDIEILIISACLAFEETARRGPRLCDDDVTTMTRNGTAGRAVLMMVHSFCKFFSFKARTLLCQILKTSGKRHLNDLIVSLGHARTIVSKPHFLITVTNLMGFTCYVAVPEYKIFSRQGAKCLLSFITDHLSRSHHLCLSNASFSSYLEDVFTGTKCCWSFSEEWEGSDLILFYSLWGLAESLQQWALENNCPNLPISNDKKAAIINTLLGTCRNNSTGGTRWFAAFVLTYFGYYGFPSKVGERLSMLLDWKEFADTKFILADGETLDVHGVLLALRCPSLLPQETSSPDDAATSNILANSQTDQLHRQSVKEVRLSSHVPCVALVKMMQYVYRGYFQTEKETMRTLKSLVKSCKLHPLYDLLSRRVPRWGSHYPVIDITPALGSIGENFFDIVLEAKPTEVLNWTCTICVSKTPHMHAHKILLWAGCDHLRAVLQSGMQESLSQVLKVPVTWDALIRLVRWIYSSELLEPATGCLWKGMASEEKIRQLETYIELSWLAEYWLLEDLQEACSKVMLQGLDSGREISLPILKIAVGLSQWKLAEIAIDFAAPSYRQLCESGKFEGWDEAIVEMVRAASVRHSQQSCI